MKIRNVWKLEDLKEPLEIHEDRRGKISDIFYNEKINHVAIVSSEPNIIRGNHYHKKTTQYTLITKGSLDYWFKTVGCDHPARKISAFTGDLICTPPNEIHALQMGPDGNEFVVFTSGPRGGKDYEADTFRVENSIVEADNKEKTK